MSSAAGGSTGERPSLSVVIAAYDAAGTLPATLASLAEQTFGDWEAIVVDDGSRDETGALADAAAAADPRIRVVHQRNGGVSAARNTAIAHARGDLISFLDADDWLAPQALEQLVGALRARPQLDGVHTGWIRVALDGREVREICPCHDENLLTWHLQNCGFAIHAAVVRRSLVQRVGGFDPLLATCEDWDFWVRLSRLGARWGRVDAHLAYYRMRPASASMDPGALLRDGLVVIDRAYGYDARVGGVPAAGDDDASAQRDRARLGHAVYSAALALGQGEDAVAVLAALDSTSGGHLGPDQVAYALYEAVPLGAATVPADWARLAPELGGRVAVLLDAVEQLTGAPQLARRAKRMLQRLVAADGDGDGDGDGDALFATVATVSLDLERALQDLAVDGEVDRLLVRSNLGALQLPAAELPACDGVVGAAAIADALVAEHAWSLLGEFLRTAVYPQLDVRVADGRLEVRRDGMVLADEPLYDGEDDRARELHDHVGWLVFLQEVWADPRATNGSIYDAAQDAQLAARRCLPLQDGWATFELADGPAQIEADGPVRVCASVAGVALAGWTAAPRAGVVTAGALRRELTARAGFELCRVVVREALLGQPLTGPSLSERLRAAAAARAAASAAGVPAVVVEDGGVAFAPGWERRARAALGGRSGHVIGRRRGAAVGLSSSRPAVLPRRAAGSALAGARAAGDPIVVVGESGSGAPLAYAPDLLWDDPSAEVAAEPLGDPPQQLDRGPGRQYFEALFAAGDDPWDYCNDYERTKYGQTLSLLPRTRPALALELACAEGHFTAMLAPHVDELVACDVSSIALRRAAARCAAHPNTRFASHDVFRDAIADRYDLVVCSEVLYYAGDSERLAHAARALAGALAPGGTLLAVHANLVVDDPGRPGFDWPLPFGARVIGEALATAGLDLHAELSNPVYRVQAYRRRERRLRMRPAPTDRRAAPLPPQLPPDVAARFLWQGGRPTSDDGADRVTRELPILMYHRVAPTGSAALRRWRVTPGEFEEQLHYLRSSGYRGVSFARWRATAERHAPLPGRRVLLTFDDGYEDFAEHAWPLLRQYGFEATVFLVTGLVGRTNGWDGHLGETVPLMDWTTIRALQAEGVQFGGHTVSHPMLTALGIEEVVEQAATCRADLARELGRPLTTTFAYPYGDVDPAVARTVGACGFDYAVTTAGQRAAASDSMLLLPRVEVAGTGGFEDFVGALTPIS